MRFMPSTLQHNLALSLCHKRFGSCHLLAESRPSDQIACEDTHGVFPAFQCQLATVTFLQRI